jgi:predicted porin
MKKLALTLVALAASATASAQSSVTLFGIVDAVLTRGIGSVSSKTELANSGYNSSRIGFRGTEDLGGGMFAGFHIEGAINNDDGTGAATNSNNQASGVGAGVAGRQGLTFGRKMHVTLGGTWGEIRLGRDYTPIYPNKSTFDTFGTNGVGSNQVQVSNIGGFTSVRASNSIGYFLPPNLGGFYGQAMYFLGENNSGAANSKDGSGAGIRVGYAAGPFNVAVATQRTRFVAGDITTTNAGVSYNAGFAVFKAMFDRDSIEGGATGKGALIGANIPFGPHEVRTSYSYYERDIAGNPKIAKVALGYVYNFSKRTNVYTTVARGRNSGGSAVGLNNSVTGANQKTTGFDVGVMHSF